ncbi:hypothetical protein MLD38_025359 [Melastoma candidum]|uniref:Uncharacterized protein n=1 Tax=Melastoma candidum TaxID=119954 RepID=A0ACB9NWH8_9MYRT|nr:hypothetical protein MLD38_025359 [Melastoma candidum]
MDANEVTTIVLSKIKGIDPDNASKIIGYLLIHDLTDKDLIRLVFGPETLLHGLILKAKSHLGSTPPGPPAKGPTLTTPPASPRSLPKASCPSSLGFYSVPSVESVRRSLTPSLMHGARWVTWGGRRVLIVPWRQWGVQVGVEMDGHYLHRRSCSGSDLGYGNEDGNGVSAGTRVTISSYTVEAAVVTISRAADVPLLPSRSWVSPGGFDHEKLMRLKLVHQKRLATATVATAAALHFVPGMLPPSPQGKYFSLLLQQQQNDAHRQAYICAITFCVKSIELPTAVEKYHLAGNEKTSTV